MTSNELITLLNELLTRKSKSIPSHKVLLSFEAVSATLDDIEIVAHEIELRINQSGLGQFDIYGFDEGFQKGEFLIQCKDENTTRVLDELREFLFNLDGFVNWYVELKIPDALIQGAYDTSFQFVKGDLESLIEEINPELPIPEGVDTPNGCLGSIVLILIISLLILA